MWSNYVLVGEKRKMYVQKRFSVGFKGSIGVWWGLVGSDGARWGQVGSGGVRWGQMGSGGVIMGQLRIVAYSCV